MEQKNIEKKQQSIGEENQGHKEGEIELVDTGGGKVVTIVKEGPNKYSIGIGGGGKTGKIYLSKDQVEKIRELKEWRIRWRKTTYTYPLLTYIEGEGETRVKKEVHLGNYLHPNNKRKYDAGMWKGEEWDLRPENLNTEATGENGEGKIKCGTCGKLTVVLRNRKVSECENCMRKEELERGARKNTGPESKSEVVRAQDFKGQENCALTDIPMTFEKEGNEKETRDTLTRASLWRIDSSKERTKENTRLVGAGLTRMKSDNDEEKIKAYIDNVGVARRVEITPKIQNWIVSAGQDIRNRDRIYGRKAWSSSINAQEEKLAKLLQSTNGVCSITKVQMDMEFKEKRGICNPSIDRIDSKKGYVEGNIQIISWGGNLIKGERATTEEARAYWDQVKKSPIRERLGK